ncbi:ankyrin repeat domain-containing protein 39 [Agrilus planipennis]|uniref:Ankyrin repeat domain-containing protein 39 n=1 Tax=Agrilus planipennis TaxID=224129 RepID=A0A7F5R695_AGRPL|nr:ankyrin repeat domain-containing protein 39 [Agrilus planipennis]
MSHPHQHNHDACHVPSVASSVYQSLDELEFERGIWYAAQYGDHQRVQKLLRSGTDVDKRDAAGYTALHYAARNGFLDVCQLLIQNGADINAITKSGNATALHRACSAGKITVVKYLMEKKANCELQDNDGKTALHRAAESQNMDICKLLLDSCSSLNKIKDFKEKLPVDYAKTEKLVKFINTSNIN